MTPTPMATLIASRRKALGLTQQQLADKLHLTNKAVSKWETGEGLPDISILKNLAEALELSTDDLLGASTIQPSSQKAVPTPKTMTKGVRIALRLALLACLFLPFIHVPLSDVLPDWLGLDAIYDGVFGSEVFASVAGWQMINLSLSGSLLGGGVVAEAVLLVLDGLDQLPHISKRIRTITYDIMICFAVALVGVTIGSKLTPQIGMILWLVLSLSLNLSQLRQVKMAN
jgi:transcriptional regulator with XRE-family HTH domain